MRRVALWVLIITAVLIPGGAQAQKGGSRTIPSGVTTPGSVMAYKGNLEVYGTVRGDATALRGDVIVHRDGRVTGNASAIGGRVRLEGGTVGGHVRTVRRDQGFRGDRSRGARHSAGRSVSLALGWLLVVTVVGVAVIAFGGDKLNIVVNTMQQGIGKSLGTGLVGQLAIVPGAIAVVGLLAATLVGIVLIPLGLMAFIFLVAGAAMLGFIAVATMTGAALTGGKNRDATPHGAMLRAFVTGTVLYLGLWIVAAALSRIPVLGAMVVAFVCAVTFVAATTGFGAVLLSYWRGEFRRAAPASV